MVRSGILLLSTLLALSCAGLRRPVDTLGAANPEAAREALAMARRSFTGARAFVSIRPEGARRFDAALEVDPRGRVALTGFSPLGTALFRIYGDGDRVLFLNERDRTWWEGSFEEFTSRTGLFRGIPLERPADLALLLFGLPVTDQGLIDGSGGLGYRVARGGLSEVTGEGGWRVTYRPVVFPAVSVRLEGEGSAVLVEHRETILEQTEVELPAPDPSWRCCALPKSIQE